jgi:hypothetical protein
LLTRVEERYLVAGEYAVGYYPSGTKQIQGSTLDLLVERVRGCVAREIIANLRARTGQDLCEDPESWIKRFKRQG